MTHHTTPYHAMPYHTAPPLLISPSLSLLFLCAFWPLQKKHRKSHLKDLAAKYPGAGSNRDPMEAALDGCSAQMAADDQRRHQEKCVAPDPCFAPPCF